MRTTKLWIAPLAWAAIGGQAMAQRGADTLVLMPAGAELPGVVTSLIELPKADDGTYVPSAEGVARSARGLATANEARELGRAFGESMAAEARENRENNSRGARPELPGPPELPADTPPPAAPEPPAGPTQPERPETPAPPRP